MQQEYRASVQMNQDGRLVLDNLPFAAGEHVRVTVVGEEAPEGIPGSSPDGAGASTDGGAAVDALAVLESLAGSIEAPANWAGEHDHYLYGSPRRADRQR